MRFVLPLAACAAASVLATPGVAAEFEPTIAIINARVVARPGHVIERGSIVVEKGRIVAVGADVAVPADAEVVDAAGMVIYPGFIDAGTHAGISRAEPAPAERTRREDKHPDPVQGPMPETMEAYRRLIHPHWRADELYDPSAAKPEDFRASGFTAGLVLPKPAILSGSSAVIQFGDRPLRRSILRSRFSQHAAFIHSTGTDSPPGDRPGYPTTIIGAMAAFRQAMLDAAWHKDLVAWSARNHGQERPPHDEDLEILASVLSGETSVAFLANSENEIHRALDMAKEFRLKALIVGAREAWKVVDRLKKNRVPLVVSLKWSDEPRKPEPPKTREKPGAAVQTTGWVSLPPVFDDEWESQPFISQRQYEERVRLWHEEVDNARQLAEAGLPFALGSFEMKSPGDLLKNLRKAVERGLSEVVALAALTRDAAALLGLSEALGEISPGRLANIVVMTGPLSDEKAKVRWVFVEGKRFDIERSVSVEERPPPTITAPPTNTAPATQPASAPAPTTAPAPTSAPATQPIAVPAPAAHATSPAASGPATAPAATAPATRPTTQPIEWPLFDCEIEADRKPRLSTGGDLLIRNANLLTVAGDDLPETDLEIRDGKIAGLARGIPEVPGVRVIDLRGYFVCPGIIDCHSHICTDGGLNEFSVSVACEVRLRDVIDHMDVAAYRALAGGVTTIHTMHGSANTIGGQNATLHLKYGKPAASWPFPGAPRTVKFALGENVKQSNFGTRGTRFPNSRMGVEAVLRRSFDAALRYKDQWAAYRRDKEAGKDPRPPRRDLRLEALAAILEGEIWIHCHCYRADEVLRLFAVAEDYGVRIGVLQHILEGYRIIPEIHRHGCGASTFSDWWAYKIEAFDAIPHNAARMAQGGVVATVNSDSAEVMRHLNLEAAKSLRFGGVDPRQALRLCTLNGAIQLGIDNKVGSLEVGKLADLAVFDGHPLDTYSRCVLTLIEGEVYFQHAEFDPDNPPVPRGERKLAPPRPPEPIEKSPKSEYWITGGTIHPVSGLPVHDGLLVIAEGKIARVGPRDGKRPPEGAVEVDASGLHVYPGLINAGATIGLVEIDSVAGSVDTRDIGEFQPDLLALSAYNPFAAAVEVTRCEGVLTALILPGGGVIPGRTGLVHLEGWSMPEAAVPAPHFLVVNLPSLPANFPEGVPEEKREEQKKAFRERLAGVESFFRKAGQYSAIALRNKGTFPDIQQRDRRLDAMIPYMCGQERVLFRADDYKQIRETIRFAERYGLRPVIFGGRESWKLAEELSRRKIDVILVRATAYPAGRFEPWDSVYQCAAVLAAHGVRFCFATGDSSTAKHVGIEAGMAVAHGLDESAALRAITLDAAAILGVADRLGSLEVGKVADVILTTDTPLQACCSVVGAFIGGRPVELASKHTRLDEKFRRRPAPPLGPEPKLRGPPAQRLDIPKAPAPARNP